MKNFYKRIFTLITIIIAVFFCIVSCDVDHEGDIQYKEEEIEELPFSVADNVLIVIYDDAGDEAATIYGDSAEFETNDDIIINNMRADFKSEENGDITYSKLISDYGKVTPESNLEAWGNVILIKEDEFRLETEKIYYFSSGDKQDEQNKSSGIVKTEFDEPVIIYYADGTVVRGKNGIWYQESNKLVLEDTYTESETSGNTENMLFNSNSSPSTPNDSNSNENNRVDENFRRDNGNDISSMDNNSKISNTTEVSNTSRIENKSNNQKINNEKLEIADKERDLIRKERDKINSLSNKTIVNTKSKISNETDTPSKEGYDDSESENE